MEKRELKKGTQVRFTWLDSAALPGWQHEPFDLTLSTIQSVGVVAGYNDQGLTVTTSLVPESGDVHAPITIPWAAIETLEIIEPKGVAA